MKTLKPLTPAFAGGSRYINPKNPRKVQKGKRKRYRRNSKTESTEMQRKLVVDPPYFMHWTIKYRQNKYEKHIQKTKQSVNWSDSFGEIFNITSGRQLVKNVSLSVGNPNHLLDIFKKGTQWYAIPNAGPVAGSHYRLTDPSGQENTSFRNMLWNSTKYTLQLTNQSPTSAEVTVYWCLAKHTSADSIWPEVAWQNGYDKSDGNTGTVSTSFVGRKPTESKEFNQRYKVIKKIKYRMLPAQENKCVLNFYPNRMLDSDYVYNMTAIKGLMIIPMVVAHGVICDNSNTIAGGTIVTTTPVKLAVLSHLTYNCTMCNFFPAINYSGTELNNDPNPFTDPNPANVNPKPLWTIGDTNGNVVDNNRDTSFA